MSNQDERAVDLQTGHPATDAADSNVNSVSDLERILTLIAAQVEDSERRQSQILEQVSQRLERLETGSEPAAQPDEATDVPALDPVEASLVNLAKQIAKPATPAIESATGKNPDVAENDAADVSHQPTHDVSQDVIAEQSSESSPSQSDPHDTFRPDDAERDVWADNAADLGPEPTVLDSQPNQQPDQQAGPVEPALSDDQPVPSEQTEPGQRSTSDVATSLDAVSASLAGNADDPWSDEDGERLMLVCEQEMFATEQPSPEPEHSKQQIPTYDELAADSDTDTPVDADIEAQADAQPAPAQAPAPQVPEASFDNIEFSKTLDERLAVVADRVEQALADMRASDPVVELRERFTRFQEDMTGAMHDVATRADIEGLKAAEAGIDDLRQHFERVQEQFARLDIVEKQLEAVMDRLSDDRLMTLLASHGSSPTDQNELAAIIGEYVANRVADKQPDVANADVAIVDEKMSGLQDALSAFMEEQRSSKSHQMGVLDTLQDAMVQVLDRVESLDAPTPHTASVEAHQPASHEYTLAENTEVLPELNAPEEAAPANSIPYQDPASDLPEAPLPVAQTIESEDDPATMSSSAISAATAATDRHPDFEPFSYDVATSHSIQSDDQSTPSNTPVHVHEASSPAGDPAPQAQQAQVEAPSAPVAGAEQDATIPGGAAATQLGAQAQTAPESEQQPAGSIARLRQEFIVEARRAKAQADAEAFASAAAIEAEPKSKGFTLFGFSFGGKSSAAPSPSYPQPAAADQPAATSTPQVFGMSRHKALIGAFVLMITASGVLLMMPRGTPKPAQVRAIERIVPQNPSAVPETAAPAAAPATDIPQQGGAPKPSGKQSELTQPPSQIHGSLSGPGNAALVNLDGIALQRSARPPTTAGLAHLANQRSMAHWSVKLGDAAARATPAGLLPEYHGSHAAAAPAPATQPVAMTKANYQAPQTVQPSSTTRSNSNLDLPPATVGPLSLRLAAAKGDPSAEFEVGTRLAAGKGTAQDFKKAVKWYQRSASRGFAQSQYRLGTFFERGLGVKKDAARARVWYKRAAEQGNIKAMHNLAVLSAGPTSTAPDYTTAAHWFALAAEHGLADSQFNLAVLYENGLGVKKSLKTAYKFYALAAGSGDKDALKRRDALKAKMSEAELAAAEAILRTWRRKPTDKLANDPFAAGQAWKSRASSTYAN